jgi:hypothetical protein
MMDLNFSSGSLSQRELCIGEFLFA